ncbi:PTS system D-fructose-specific IIB component (F1P-forming), Frc family (TC 4.A.2.1.1)/PTS system D-fructose-specific IIC component (F1P-forming), Frc family (TC 4.A.2.1.1) [Methylobacterium sp. ap11]|uniref:PTS fructose transporter subunit IIC n=1 Tax=Methylobacterium sp. ap11 TaxID=1761799 RepID=UPI0008C8F832|nr:fructose-specific PTS transporter subunit EIIC [Methylobacterium sp. ap11]SEO41998.1 PTS system D-fructose-specific IIB component (F1P-forming), Frc family (TC 4.A.2.1.1)/PTS system D-fructose-specific IIC component (F1P-forming), Frc family (TC 4.A.2.1.1) [Methylobacterium sp. ap11]
MTHLVAVVGGGDLSTHAVLAAEALRRAAGRRNQRLDLELRGRGATGAPLSEGAIRDADAVLLVGTGDLGEGRFGALHRAKAAIEDVLADVDAVIDRALSGKSLGETSRGAAPEASRPKRIVAITSCPTGIAHTFMAAEGIQAAAQALGHRVRVETQGSVGARDALTQEEIAAADIVLIAADTGVDRGRFSGKRVYATTTKAAIRDGKGLIATALKDAELQGADAAESGPARPAAETKAGAYKHLMTGVSFMLPFVVAGGLLIALAFAFGGIDAMSAANKGSLGFALGEIGAKAAFALIVPALAGYIAFSIADRPGIAPGMIGGMLAANLNAGFLGGIAAGFIAGYTVAFLSRSIRLPKNLEGLKPVLILPLVGTLVTGLLMVYVVGVPVAALLAALTGWLKGMQGASALVLGLILGGMMAVDMGGPINKAAYASSAALISSGIYTPMAAVMLAGMTPPLGIALATRLFPGRFTAQEREAGTAAAVLGAAFITEGAIPFAAADPLRVIPALVAGSAAAGAVSMTFGVALRVPHGGLFVLPIPNAITPVLGAVAALVVGTLITAVLVGVLKKRAA